MNPSQMSQKVLAQLVNCDCSHSILMYLESRKLSKDLTTEIFEFEQFLKLVVVWVFLVDFEF